MEEIAQKKSNTTAVLISMAILLAIIGSGAWWFFHKGNFVISNVPFITLYNHAGKNAHVVTSQGASLISVLEYYGSDFSDTDYQKINSVFFTPEDLNKLRGIIDIQSYAKQLGYDTKIEKFGSLRDLKKYINSRSKIPLIFGHLLATDQDPLIQQSPYGVLIGVLEKENAVVVHDYYWGYNKKIGWDDFKKMAKSQYLVIQPKNSDILGNKKILYPTRTASMNKAAPLIDKITLVRVAYNQKLYDIAFKVIQEVIADKDFEENVPPYYKLVAYTRMAESYRKVEKNLDKAMEFALKAQELNHDLDKPFGDYWPGFEDGTNTIINKYSGAPQVLGHVYQAKKEFELAKKAYQEALDIWSDNVGAQTDLFNLNKLLNKN